MRPSTVYVRENSIQNTVHSWWMEFGSVYDSLPPAGGLARPLVVRHAGDWAAAVRRVCPALWGRRPVWLTPNATYYAAAGLAGPYWPAAPERRAVFLGDARVA